MQDAAAKLVVGVVLSGTLRQDIELAVADLVAALREGVVVGGGHACPLAAAHRGMNSS